MGLSREALLEAVNEIFSNLSNFHIICFRILRLFCSLILREICERVRAGTVGTNTTVHGAQSMGYGVWCTEYGVQNMVYGVQNMVYGV
jgi:hypothetical protein